MSDDLEQILQSMTTVFVVMKNTDFTEGKGPMQLHKIFQNERDAVLWITRQPGIYGGKQEETTLRSSDGVRHFNGYIIVPHSVIPEGLLSRSEELKLTLDSAEANMKAHEMRAKRIRSILD